MKLAVHYNGQRIIALLLCLSPVLGKAQATPDTIYTLRIRKPAQDTLTPRKAENIRLSAGFDYVYRVGLRLRAGFYYRHNFGGDRPFSLLTGTLLNTALLQGVNNHLGIQLPVIYTRYRRPVHIQFSPGLDYFFADYWRVSMRMEVGLRLFRRCDLWAGYDIGKKTNHEGFQHAFTVSLAFNFGVER